MEVGGWRLEVTERLVLTMCADRLTEVPVRTDITSFTHISARIPTWILSAGSEGVQTIVLFCGMEDSGDVNFLLKLQRTCCSNPP